MTLNAQNVYVISGNKKINLLEVQRSAFVSFTDLFLYTLYKYVITWQ